MNTKHDLNLRKHLKILFAILLVITLTFTSAHSRLAYTLQGDLDPTFGLDGWVTTTISDSSTEFGLDVVIQPDGKIVVAGMSTGLGFLILRYQSDGTLDTSFGSDGKAIPSVSERAFAVTLQQDGKIVATGHGPGVDGMYNDITVARFTADGTLDSSFGNGGKVTTDYFGYHDYGYDLVILDDGKILVSGAAQSRFDVPDMAPYGYHCAMVRYNPDGTLDSSFGTDGKVLTDISPVHVNDSYSSACNSLALRDDGSFVAAGGYLRDFLLIAYDADGNLDTSFGIDGVVRTDFANGWDDGKAISIQSDGKILVAGWATVYANRDFALARYNPNGSLDTSFGTNGKVTVQLGGEDEAYGIALQPDGKILVVGGVNNAPPTGFAVLRFNPDGSLDSTFGTAGKIITDFGNDGLEGARAVALQPDGRIVVTGTDFQGSYWGPGDVAVARYFGESYNQPPLADVGGPYSGFVGKTITLDASASSDPNGDALTYEWDLDSDGEFDDATGITTTTIFDQAGEYTIGVRVTDPLGLADADTATVTVNQPVPVPSLEVVPYDPHSGPLNIVLGSDWEAGTTVTLCIDNPPYDSECDYIDSQTVPTEPNGFAGKQFDFEVDPLSFVIKAGQRVQLDNGLHTEEHIVTNLRLLWVDWETDTAGGMAAPGSNTGISAILDPHDGSPRSGAFRQVTADSQGNWTADFAHPDDTPDEQATIDLDLSIGNVIFLPEQKDANGNSTRFWMQGDPRPMIDARFHENEIHGYGWPLGMPVTLTIDDPDNGVGVDYADTQTVVLLESNPNQTFVEFRLWENNFELENGQIVAMSDGIISKTHTVTVPTIAAIGHPTNTVGGIAVPSSEIWVNYLGATRHETAKEDGSWMADFSVPGNEEFESQTASINWPFEGEVHIDDEDGDSTAINWGLGYILLDLDNNGQPTDVYLRHWPGRLPVTMMIDNPETPANPDYTASQSMFWSDGYSHLTMSWNGFDVLPGFTITVTDGHTTREILVPLLAITGYDLVNDTISGIADPYAKVLVVGPCSLEECSNPAEIEVVADGNGNWSANFADVQFGEGFEAQIYEEDWDVTVLRDWFVQMELKGFYQPVDMNGIYNLVKGGSTVPFKFEIFAGSTELIDTTYVTSLTYTPTMCDANAITDVIEITVTGDSNLRYDATAGQFIYNWKTPRTPGMCYRVTMTIMDGSSRVAFFKLK